MPRDNRILLLAIFGILGVAFVLSRIDWSPGPKLYPVSGTLTIGGSPASKVQINFVPLNGGAQISSSQIQDDGKFSLYWGIDGRAGAEPGKYRIVLSQMPGSRNPVYVGPDARRIPNMPPATFPPRYLEATTSPEEVEVLKKNNFFEIQVEMPSGSAGETAPESPPTAPAEP